MLLVALESVEEGVVIEVDAPEVIQPAAPSASLLRCGIFGDSVVGGLASRNDVSHEQIVGGS